MDKKEKMDFIYGDRSYKSKWKYIKDIFLYPEIKMLFLFRKAQYFINRGKNGIIKKIWSLKWLRLRKKTCYQISLQAQIGKGLCFLHDGARVIVKKAVIGENCTIGINVIIGYGCFNGKYEAPKIGSRVYIGHNSSIVGGIIIGDDVLIAPNSYVNKNIPNHSIVLGNNIIIPKKNASQPFLKIGP